MLKCVVFGGVVEIYFVVDGFGVVFVLDGGVEKSWVSLNGGVGNVKGVYGDGGGFNGLSFFWYVVGFLVLFKIWWLIGINGIGIVWFGYVEMFLWGLRWEVERRVFVEFS